MNAFGPLSLLAASLLPVLGAPAIHSARHGLAAVGIVLLVALPMVRDWRSTLWRLGLGAIAGLSIGVSTYLYGGREVDVAVGAAMRVMYLIVPAAVLTPYIDPVRLGDHLAQRLHLPARAVVASTAALQRLDSLGEQWRQIARARRARGVGPDGGLIQRARVTAGMTLALLVSTMRSSASMSLAMDARGFAGAHRRTWAEPAPWRWGDTAVLAAGVGLALLPWLLPAIPGGLVGVE